MDAQEDTAKCIAKPSDPQNLNDVSDIPSAPSNTVNGAFALFVFVFRVLDWGNEDMVMGLQDSMQQIKQGNVNVVEMLRVAKEKCESEKVEMEKMFALEKAEAIEALKEKFDREVAELKKNLIVDKNGALAAQKQQLVEESKEEKAQLVVSLEAQCNKVRVKTMLL